MKRFVLSAILLLSALAAPAGAEDPASGPSFDCQQATSTLDRAICADAELAALDRDMAARYRAAQANGDDGARALIGDTQRQWAHTRAERCALPPDGDAGADALACLKQLYQARIAELAALQPTDAVDPVAWVEGLWQVESLVGVSAGTLSELAAGAFVGRLVLLQRSAVASLTGASCAGPDFHLRDGGAATIRLDIACLGTTMVELSWPRGGATRAITWTERGASFSLKRVATATQLMLSRGLGQSGAPAPGDDAEPLE